MAVATMVAVVVVMGMLARLFHGHARKAVLSFVMAVATMVAVVVVMGMLARLF